MDPYSSTATLSLVPKLGTQGTDERRFVNDVTLLLYKNGLHYPLDVIRENADNNDDWVAQDRQARAYILLNMTSARREVYMSYATASDLMQALRKQYTHTLVPEFHFAKNGTT